MKTLFILKKRRVYGGTCPENSNFSSSGLYNSAKFVVDMLVDAGVDAKLVEVVDNNSIDKEVYDFQPNCVFIEALWVVPEKFDVLKKLHPKVKWIVRVHSDLPFIASEGTAIEWIRGYLRRGVAVAFNDPRIAHNIKKMLFTWGLITDKVLYLPNFYPFFDRVHVSHNHYVLKIGCFGAVRPLKNQLIQAVAAIEYANKVGRRLEFFVNGTRCEQGGNAVLKNLRNLFKETQHTLVEIDWMPHEQFVKLLAEMDVVLAASFSETFCIVAADSVAAGVPLICSSEVPWASELSVVPCTDSGQIVKKLHNFLRTPLGFISTQVNRIRLFLYSRASKKTWLKTLGA